MPTKIIERANRWGANEILIHDTEALEFRARLATAFVTQWGMVAGRPDGEDKAGRSKLALLTPDEVVQRACDTANLLHAEFSKRHWLVAVPEPKSETPMSGIAAQISKWEKQKIIGGAKVKPGKKKK